MTSSEFIEQYAKHPHYKAPRGMQLHAKSWQTEAPLRMLLNRPQITRFRRMHIDAVGTSIDLGGTDFDEPDEGRFKACGNGDHTG